LSYHRFIGGPHDAEWHDVRREHGLFLPPIWTVAERPEVKLHTGPVTIEGTYTSKATDYVPLPLHIGGEEVVTFFIEHGMKPKDALLRLAECYNPKETTT
jgi:hypothetical protein